MNKIEKDKDTNQIVCSCGNDNFKYYQSNRTDYGDIIECSNCGKQKVLFRKVA